jgi:hypothetical protein
MLAAPGLWDLSPGTFILTEVVLKREAMNMPAVAGGKNANNQSFPRNSTLHLLTLVCDVLSQVLAGAQFADQTRQWPLLRSSLFTA